MSNTVKNLTVDTSSGLGTSDLVVPTQYAVKQYVDAATGSSGVQLYGAIKTATTNMYSPYGFNDASFHDDPHLVVSLPIGIYTGVFTEYLSMGSGGTGFKWQMVAGTATYTEYGNRSTSILTDVTGGFPQFGNYNTFATGRNLDGTNYTNTGYSSIFTTSLSVTVAGTVKIQIGTNTSGDSGQFLAGSSLIFTKLA